MADDAPVSTRTLDIRFVGSGSEYFRIWIVNLLLTIVTLGFYYPFAKVRRLRYFHGCTEVDGHPLDFHANPWAMLRGYGLVALLSAVYALAQQFSDTAAGVALLLMMAIGPALWWSSLRFRLANTSWRGVRLRFGGRLADAYRTAAPAYALVALFIVAGLVLGDGDTPRRPGVADGLLMLLPLLGALALPWMLWRVRRYQHDHYAFASEQTRLRVGPAPVAAVFLRASLLGGAVGLAVVVAVGVVVATVGGSLDPRAALRPGMATLLVGLPLVVVLALQVVARGYLVARLQNLFWSSTASARVRFDSRLRARRLIGVTARNWALMIVTLGLYYPFAAVAQARVRLEAVAIHTRVDIDALVARSGGATRDAAGDAAADLLGFDIGL
ncbi:MAG: YjgN family protein [Rubrivivax sp.]